MGDNLTFTFDLGGETRLTSPSGGCFSVKEEYMFPNAGTYLIGVQVVNTYGSLESNLTVVVIEKILSNITFDLDPESSTMATMASPVVFTVSMVTTSRSGRWLKVWYGDGHDNIVSLADTDSPQLVLLGNGNKMDIVASYGQGCTLTVEFMYIYQMEGKYRPRVAVFDDASVETMDLNDGIENLAMNLNLTDSTQKTDIIRIFTNMKFDQNVDIINTSDDMRIKRSARGIIEMVEAELASDLNVLSEVNNVKLLGPKVAKCGEDVMFQLNVVSKLNLTVHWLVVKINSEDLDSDDPITVEELNETCKTPEGEVVLTESDEKQINDVEIIEDFTSMETVFFYKFDQSGAYVVTVRVKNPVSESKTSANFDVQCPVEGLRINCPEVVETYAEVVCNADVTQGSDVTFTWFVEGQIAFQGQQNHGSVFQYIFPYAYTYYISVKAYNNVSADTKDIDVLVQERISAQWVHILKAPHTMLGNRTDFAVVYKPSKDDAYTFFYMIMFDFDFGDGRANQELTENDHMCYAQTSYIFPIIGQHSVTVYVYNKVSEYSETIQVGVYPDLRPITVETVQPAVVGMPIRFIALNNGKTMETGAVYFTWMLGNGEVRNTTSPLAETVFEREGTYTVYVEATNPVSHIERQVTVVVKASLEDNFYLDHDLFATPGEHVTFDLQSGIQVDRAGWSKLLVRYGDGTLDHFDKEQTAWQHQFTTAGIQHVSVTVLDGQGVSLKEVTSHLSVQTPIADIALSGTETVIYTWSEYGQYGQWRANLDSGTGVLYQWSFGNTELLAPTDLFEIKLPKPGEYVLQVSAFNDVTHKTHTASLNVKIVNASHENTIHHVGLSLLGGLVGEETYFKLNITGRHFSQIDLVFGDGTKMSLTSHSSSVMITSLRDDLHIVYLKHRYLSAGLYDVKANVSNSISSFEATTKFSPIVNVTLTSKSRTLIQTPGHVVAIAYVEGGENVNFVWNFSDGFGETLIRRFDNNTVVAKHPYGLSGEYEVSVNVTGKHYPAPGISRKLPRKFIVQDAIDMVKLYANQNASAWMGNTSEPVTFSAKSSGSHVWFMFDFGDGHQETVPGLLASHMNVDVTMFADTSHTFTGIGEYNVSVTAYNCIGKKMVHLAKTFWVQTPPSDLHFCAGQVSSVKVGEVMTLCANVTSGTDVIYDWKLGDQSDLVKAGPWISHVYMTSGTRKVSVTARNHVKKLVQSINILVNYHIQGVELQVNSTIVAAGEQMPYTAIVRPSYPNSPLYYKWRFKSSIVNRNQWNGEFKSISNYMRYAFPYIGRCVVSVTAFNAISNASASIDVYVVARISKLEVVLLSNVTERVINRQIRFKPFAYGSNMTLTWNFGDGSGELVTNKTEVNHSFASESVYNITVLAKNSLGSQIAHKLLFVLDKPYCDEPKIVIISKPYTKRLYSQPFTIEADVKSNCNLTSTMAYNWSIDDHVTRNKSRVLVLPPGRLSLGNHTVSFRVDMVGTLVYSSVMTVVSISPSPLVAKISGGLLRWFKIRDVVTVDGSQSFDPDDKHSQNFSCSWTCQYLSEDGSYGDGCFHSNKENTSACNITMNTSILEFPSECLVPANNYTFELTVHQQGRENGTAFQTITVVKSGLHFLDVSIVQPDNCLNPVNPDRKTSFSVVCQNCPHTGVHYSWFLRHVANYNIHSYARVHDMGCVDKDGMAYQLVQEEAEAEKRRKEAAETIKITTTSPVQTDMPLEQVTRAPSLYDMMKIEEAPSDSVTKRGRPPFGYVNILEEKTSGSMRGNFRDIDFGEGKDVNGARGLPVYSQSDLFDGEGMPGESGSAGGRKYHNTYPDIGREQAGTHRGGVGRYTDTEDDVGSGGSTDSLDKLVGSRKDIRRRLTILDKPLTTRLYLPPGRTRTGLHSESLVIKPGFLRQGLTYIIGVKVTADDGSLEGEALLNFDVNESPVYGNCRIRPENGTALDTSFTVHCYSWRDQHEPLMYEVSYSLGEREPRQLIYRGVNHQVHFQLPPGKPELHFTVNVYIDILDALLAKTSVCLTEVKVVPKSEMLLDTLQGWTDTLPELTLLTEAQLIYEEVTSPERGLQTSLKHGDDAVSKVYIGYLATWINILVFPSMNTSVDKNSDTVDSDISSTAAYVLEDRNITFSQNSILSDDAYVIEEDNSKEALHALERAYRLVEDLRTQLLTILETLPVRDEAEVMQTAQALDLVTAKPEQLTLSALDKCLFVLRLVTDGARNVYSHDLVPTGDLLSHISGCVANVVLVANMRQDSGDERLDRVYSRMVADFLYLGQDIVWTEMRYQAVSETPLVSTSDHYSIMATRHSSWNTSKIHLSLAQASFELPADLSTVIESSLPMEHWRGMKTPAKGPNNHRCFQSHMTALQSNPYISEDNTQISTLVIGLELYDCEGKPVNVSHLPPESPIHIQLPIRPQQVPEFHNLTLKKWEMNVHQFNVTLTHLKHALHIVVELKPWQQGRPFQLSVLISFLKPPSPSNYKFKYDLGIDENVLDIFLPPGSLNDTGLYYIGLVDSTFNTGRQRPLEVTHRNYSLKLWWGQCLYWNSHKELWLPDGCFITPSSSLEVTECSCNQSTMFGASLQLTPNKLSFTDIEGFFSPNENPVALTLLGIVVLLYVLLLFCCYHGDLHDNRKGGIVYLLDNTPLDQQKYEITMETGFWRNAGTTSKISIILHGEEGMSETRELISEDDRPMFERNSRDKFILTLPDSIGRIWKVQVWHNNFGPSPSWYLSRVIVRDLITGVQYMFLCEKWLAVEEQDGKVEREFMVLDGTLDFTKAYMTKAVEYMADFHIWLSILTCPPNSGFMRCERLTVCLTMILAYMCLNAMWYRTAVTEYRGEFGLLDLSSRNVSVGAICCAVVIPLGRFIEFLFRRSKPKHASCSQSSPDTVAEWEPEFPSGKPNEADSVDSSEQIQPIMTYSLLDQSILNWPNIQTWAQKQWRKRQQTHTRGNQPFLSDLGNSGGGSEVLGHSNHCNLGLSPPHHDIPGVNPMDLAALQRYGLSEMDQASSGFEDCSSLIRPKASMDSTHTTAAPSVNESTRVHKPQSISDSLAVSTKLPSEAGTVKTSKAPSISSTASNKSIVHERRRWLMFGRLYLPYWCRYIAWALCAAVCVACATVTIMYGYRFGTTMSMLWLQSLYFSLMICVFIANPILILLAVISTALEYKRDPNYIDNHGYDIFNREKAQADLKQWKQQLDFWDKGDALERGVAARQRSRYLRFTRPPQEKQLIEARKRVMKEKRAVTMFKEIVSIILTLSLLLVMAYGKDTTPSYRLNLAVKNQFTQGDDLTFDRITSPDDWYHWAQTGLLDVVEKLPKLPRLYAMVNSTSSLNTYLIGDIILRQQRTVEIPCPISLPYVHSSCLGNSATVDTGFHGNITGLGYRERDVGNVILGRDGMYDGSGFVLQLSQTRWAASSQIQELMQTGWLDRRTKAVFVEATLYNPPTNLFTSVRLLTEMSPTGGVSSLVKVTSTQLFRYVTTWDNVLLACELLFFVIMPLSIKTLVLGIIQDGRDFLFNLWNVLSLVISIVSAAFCGCFIYRFAIIADIVEQFRSTYYEKHVNVVFVTLWDEILRSMVGVLLFVTMVRGLRALRFHPQFARFGDVYRKARREMIILFALFSILLLAFSSLGHLVFGAMTMTFRDLWTSLFGVVTLMSGRNVKWGAVNREQSTGASLFVFIVCVFGMGILLSYALAVLSHYLRSHRRRRLLSLGALGTLRFYWEQFQLWTGLKHLPVEEEPPVILPPEFTMAEIEYQVDELLFRMNALTGSHGLPEKPPCYLTDSDCTYGGGDDGISSGGSEGGVFMEDRLGQRVQKIEDNLCSQEPFLAQLLKLDNVHDNNMSHEKEKQLRSHLELEIFRQLQIQRQDLQPGDQRKADKRNNLNQRKTGKGDNDEADSGNPKAVTKTPNSPGQDSTSSEEAAKSKSPALKPLKPRRTRSNLTVKTIQDILGGVLPQDTKDTHTQDNSSSNPDSPRDKLGFSKLLKPSRATKQEQSKRNNSTSSSEKISDSSNYSNEQEFIKKPTKPTFLHSRESSLSDGLRGGPSLKILSLGTEKTLRCDGAYLTLPDTSSGSEQDGMQSGKKPPPPKHSLRKTKSRGKGKGPDSLEPALILDELDCEDVNMEYDNTTVTEAAEEPSYNANVDSELRDSKTPGYLEQVVTADVHHIFQ
ncbi:uncharacterized protein LOC128232845 isoform X2 [Mya arenaria]|nr:uncharacterized protein LOC128232845 isoform X2 [Mya arenaria]XP_052802591.1 uncharacterized protein LOC128232845 isoform X2 [Mya arenaria]XP_052802599.1 uncharacterized protein LOC128232845 isoform X2 [Mya arenaria]